LMKIHKKTSFEGLSAEQVFVGMVTDHETWMNKPLIKVANPLIKQLAGVTGDYASFSNFIDEEGKYKLTAQIEKAYIKAPASRNQYDKDLINVDERVNVCFMVLNGSILTIFPIANHTENKWVAPNDFHQLMGHGTTEGDYFENYTNGLNEGIETGNYQKADEALAAISDYQQSEGKSIIPSATKTK